MEGDSEGDEEDEDFQAMACMFEEEIAVTSEQMVAAILIRVAMEGEGVLGDYDLSLRDLSPEACEVIIHLRRTGVGQRESVGASRYSTGPQGSEFFKSYR